MMDSTGMSQYNAALQQLCGGNGFMMLLMKVMPIIVSLFPNLGGYTALQLLQMLAGEPQLVNMFPSSLQPQLQGLSDQYRADPHQFSNLSSILLHQINSFPLNMNNIPPVNPMNMNSFSYNNASWPVPPPVSAGHPPYYPPSTPGELSWDPTAGMLPPPYYYH